MDRFVRCQCRVFAALVTVVVTTLTSVGVAPTAGADDSQVVIIVLDLSGSMNEALPDGRTKLAAAKEGLTTLVGNLPDGINVGFWVYGDQFPSAGPATDQRRDNCLLDARRVAPVQPLDRAGLTAQIASFTGKGDTPVSLALSSAVVDIPATAQGTVVLVSDGRDECYDADLDGNPAVGPTWGQAPCAVAENLKNAGVAVRLDKIETVGFLTDTATAEELRCIARVTGGSFTPIESAAELAPKVTEIVAAVGRTPQRLGGTAVVGGPAPDSAGSLRAGPGGMPAGRYTDAIRAGEDRWYELPLAGDGLGVYSVTVFGLPVQEGITLAVTPFDQDATRELDDLTLTKEQAGMDRVGADSVRETVTFTGYDEGARLHLRVRLTSEQPLPTPFDVELMFEGLLFGGDPTGCPITAVCGVEARAAVAEVEAEELRPTVEEARGDLESAKAELATARAERDRLRSGGGEFELSMPITVAAGLVAGMGLLALILASRTRVAADAAPTDPTAVAVIGSIDDTGWNGEGGPFGDGSDPAAVGGAPDGATVMSDAASSQPDSTAPVTESSVLWSSDTVAASASTESAASGAPPAAAPASTPAGWYPDPYDPALQRYWDGAGWTDHVAPGVDR